MSIISANTLFHFTNSFENLESILTHNFYPHFSLEIFQNIYEGNTLEAALPMVCFCDIPLSQVQEHTKIYGKYCIGLNKEWGLRNGISPVFYIYTTSDSTNRIRENVTKSVSDTIKQSVDSMKGKFESKDLLNEKEMYELFKMFFEKTAIPLTNLMTNILPIEFLKQYKGKLFRNNKYIDNITFYNEREWRYLPTTFELVHNDISIILTKDQFIDENNIQSQHERLKKTPLVFTPNDVKYIIVEKEEDIIRMLDLIPRLKGNKYNYDDVRKLSSRILTIEQVLEDF